MRKHGPAFSFLPWRTWPSDKLPALLSSLTVPSTCPCECIAHVVRRNPAPLAPDPRPLCGATPVADAVLGGRLEARPGPRIPLRPRIRRPRPRQIQRRPGVARPEPVARGRLAQPLAQSLSARGVRAHADAGNRSLPADRPAFRPGGAALARRHARPRQGAAGHARAAVGPDARRGARGDPEDRRRDHAQAQERLRQRAGRPAQPHAALAHQERAELRCARHHRGQPEALRRGAQAARHRASALQRAREAQPALGRGALRRPERLDDGFGDLQRRHCRAS